MCWKKSTPAPVPSPPMLLSYVTEAVRFNATETVRFNATEALLFNETEVVDASVCPHSTFPCNSTTVSCYNGGTICCNQHNVHDAICICRTGWEAPNCLLEEISLPFHSMSGYFDFQKSKIGVIVLCLGILLAISIAVGLIVLIKRRRRQPSARDTSTEQFPMRQGRSGHIDPACVVTVPARPAESAPFLSKDTNGNDKG